MSRLVDIHGFQAAPGQLAEFENPGRNVAGLLNQLGMLPRGDAVAAEGVVQRYADRLERSALYSGQRDGIPPQRYIDAFWGSITDSEDDDEDQEVPLSGGDSDGSGEEAGTVAAVLPPPPGSPADPGSAIEMAAAAQQAQLSMLRAGEEEQLSETDTEPDADGPEQFQVPTAASNRGERRRPPLRRTGWGYGNDAPAADPDELPEYHPGSHYNLIDRQRGVRRQLRRHLSGQRPLGPYTRGNLVREMRVVPGTPAIMREEGYELPAYARRAADRPEALADDAQFYGEVEADLTEDLQGGYDAPLVNEFYNIQAQRELDAVEL